MDNRISFSVSTEDSSHQLVQFSFVGREQRTESVQCSVGEALSSADLSVQSLCSFVVTPPLLAARGSF